MHLTQELVSERTRHHLELASQIQLTRKYRALTRARRTERKAERRMVEAWRARCALESALGLEEQL